MSRQITFYIGGRITVQLIFRLDLTQGDNMLLFVHSEAAESILVKLETSRTVILPPTVRAFGLVTL